LADGREILIPTHIGAVDVGSVTISPITVLAIGDEPLIGRGITDRFRVIFDHGKQLIFEP